MSAFLSPPNVIQLHRLIKLATISHDIFKFFIYDEEKRKIKSHQIIFLECHCSLKPENLVKF